MYSYFLELNDMKSLL